MTLVSRLAFLLISVIALFAASVSSAISFFAAFVALFSSYYVAYRTEILTIRNPLLVSATLTFVVLAAFKLINHFAGDNGGLEIDAALPLPQVLVSSRATDAVQVTAICVVSMLVGANLAVLATTRRLPPAITPSIVSAGHFPAYALIALLPLCANLVLYTYWFSDRSYIDVHLAAQGPLKYILFSIYLSYGATLLMFLSMLAANQSMRRKIVLLLIIGLWGLIYAGLYQTRSNLFILVMLFLYIYWEKLGSTRVVLLATVSVVVFLAMALLRDPALRAVAVSAAGWQLLGLGSFVDNVAYAMSIGEQHGLMYGATYLRLLSDIGYSPSQAYVGEFMPSYSELGGGLGFFYVAEAVLNFGVVGAATLFFGIGYLLTRAALSTGGFYYWVLNPVLVATSFLWIRNEFSSAGKSVVYLILGFFLARWISVLLKLAATSANDPKHDTAIPFRADQVR